MENMNARVGALLTDSILQIRILSGGRGFYRKYDIESKQANFLFIRPKQMKASITAREQAAINELSEICHNLPPLLLGEQGVTSLLPSIFEQANTLYAAMGWNVRF